ncbi:hypothetical protein R69608_01417 [Paraburkholderia nemoris]|nr:hypothetical protein R69608_01417 [Paraburkholderia nemoris]
MTAPASKSQNGGKHHSMPGRSKPAKSKGMTLEQFRAQLRERRDAMNPEVTK